ncbi:MAG: transporter substrate-binding domain-containing protein [Cyanobacteria bacterium J06597_16]
MLSAVMVIRPHTAMAAELSEIRDRGYLIVAVKDNQPPLGFIDSAGNLNGFEIEIAQRLAEVLLGDPSAIQLVPTSNIDRLNAVVDDRVDVAIAGITLTEPRRRIVTFSDPYYLDGATFITNQSAIQQLRDLRLSKIAILDQSSTVAHVRYILPAAQLIGVGSYAEGRDLLDNGSVDAFAGDASVLSGWILSGWRPNDTETETIAASTPSERRPYHLLPHIISAEPLSIAMPKGTRFDPLRTSINQAIRQWYTEGWLQESATTWGLPAESSPQFLELRLLDPRPATSEPQ